jgi:hypothetical protein
VLIKLHDLGLWNFIWLFVRRYIGSGHMHSLKGANGGLCKQPPILPTTDALWAWSLKAVAAPPGKRSTIIRLELNYYKFLPQ